MCPAVRGGLPFQQFQAEVVFAFARRLLQYRPQEGLRKKKMFNRKRV